MVLLRLSVSIKLWHVTHSVVRALEMNPRMNVSNQMYALAFHLHSGLISMHVVDYQISRINSDWRVLFSITCIQVNIFVNNVFAYLIV